MKVKLQLQPGSIGIGFDGRPAVVRRVVPTSPYHAWVQPHKTVVAGVTIPGVVAIDGLDVDSLFLIALLKEYSDTPGRVLTLEERPFLEQKRVRSKPRPSLTAAATTTTTTTTTATAPTATPEGTTQIPEQGEQEENQENDKPDDGDDDDDEEHTDEISEEKKEDDPADPAADETPPPLADATATPEEEEEVHAVGESSVDLQHLVTTNEPTAWKIFLPTGKLGIRFGNAPHWGPAVIETVLDDSPLAKILVPGLQFQSLHVPGVADFADVLHADRVMSLLDSLEDVPGRVLHLGMPRNEVASLLPQPSSSPQQTLVPTRRYIPLAGSSLCMIEGATSQMATVSLGAGQSIQSAAESMVYMSETIVEEQSRGRSDSFSRISADERIRLSIYTLPASEDPKKKEGAEEAAGTSPPKQVRASAPGRGTIALAPSYPAQIFAVDLTDYGGAIIAGSRNFLFTNDEGVMLFAYSPLRNPPPSATTSPTNASPKSPRSPAASPSASTSPTAKLLRGEGSIRMHRIMGVGKVFLTGGGIVMQKHLRRGETIRVSTKNVVAYQFGMSVVMEGVKGLGNVVVWGQGMAVLTGPGEVWIESQPSTRHGLLEKR